MYCHAKTLKQTFSDLQAHVSRRRQHRGQRPRRQRPQDDGRGRMHRWHATLQCREWGKTIPHAL